MNQIYHLTIYIFTKGTLANMTNGYVAADINATCREAAMLAVQRASKNLQE